MTPQKAQTIVALRLLGRLLSVRRLLSAIACLAFALTSTSTGAADATLDELLKSGVEAQLQGDFDRSSEIALQIKRAFPTNAIGHAFEMNSLVTQLSWDAEDTQFDESLEAEATQTLKLCKQQIKNEPDVATGYYLCGQAHFALTFLYAARGSYYSAGRNSSQTIKQLENALKRDPGLSDAKMHLGATYYYADNLPSFVKAISRFLWFIPSGNSDKALPYMREAANDGEYLGDAAKFIFADLVMSSEPTLIDEAGEYLMNLVTRYPSNRRFQLKRMQYLAQTKQYPELLDAVNSYTGPEHCCPVEPIDASIARLWRVRANLALQDRTAAQQEFDAVGVVDFPSWGNGWHEEIKQMLATAQ